ncbi:MAG: hypothetical protein IPJ77_10665 [Planctomycetes bacterium]|nr:hypothetical protein [Planctomycetota bacterium]
MDFSAGPLITSLVVGSVGFGLYRYGRKAERMPQLLTGVVLMVFPYFVPGVAWMIGIAVGLIGGLVVAVRNGL